LVDTRLRYGLHTRYGYVTRLLPHGYTHGWLPVVTVTRLLVGYVGLWLRWLHIHGYTRLRVVALPLFIVATYAFTFITFAFAYLCCPQLRYVARTVTVVALLRCLFTRRSVTCFPFYRFCWTRSPFAAFAAVDCVRLRCIVAVRSYRCVGFAVGYAVPLFLHYRTLRSVAGGC